MISRTGCICIGVSIGLMLLAFGLISLGSENPPILEIPIAIKAYRPADCPDGHLEPPRLFDAATFLEEASIVSMGNYVHYVENANVFHACHSKEQPDLADAFKSSFLDGHPGGWYSPDRAFLYVDQDKIVRVCDDTGPEAEAHPSQLLATLASLGIASSRVVRSGEHEATIGDLVRLLQGEFHLKGEIEWKVMALARYSPTHRTWTNRWGKSHSSDSIVPVLMKTFRDDSCYGTHKLQALAVILKTDAIHPIISSSTRRSIVDYLKVVIDKLELGQRPEGYWAPDWFTPHPNRQDFRKDGLLFSGPQLALATGHHMEWLDLTAPDLDVSAKTRQAAVQWCLSTTRRVTRDEARSQLCAYSHCFRVAVRDATPK